MPQRSTFETDEDYWATFWHEVIHWTGHPKRLNRQRHRRWGDETYAFEELIAELGAAFLCTQLGVSGKLQHAAYLESWCKCLEEGGTLALWHASESAAKARDFVLDRSDSSDGTEGDGRGLNSESRAK